MPELATPHCQHTHLPNGIDHFLLLQNTRQAVDEYLAFLEAHLVSLKSNQSHTPYKLFLIEVNEKGMPPAAYMSQQYKKLLQAYPGKRFRARVAYLYRDGFVLSIAKSFLSLIRNNSEVERRFFAHTERAQAEMWLLEKQT